MVDMTSVQLYMAAMAIATFTHSIDQGYLGLCGGRGLSSNKKFLAQH